MIKNEYLLRLTIFFIGLLFLSLGIAMIIEADLGVGAWDVLHVGLYETFGLTVGTWSIIVGLSVVLITLFIDRKIISIGTVLNMIFTGLFIDMFMYLIPTMDNTLAQYTFLLLGIIVMGIGVGLYIAPKIGSGPRDSMLLALTRKYNWKISRVKTYMELIALTLGYFLGGPVFIGTIIVSISVGPIMQFSIKWWDKKLEVFFQNRTQIKGQVNH